MDKNYNGSSLYFKIKHAVENVNSNKAKEFLLSIPYSNWIRYAVTGLYDEKRIDSLSEIISSAYSEVENNGYKGREKEEYLNLIIDPLIKASGNKKQKQGFRKTIARMASKEGEKKVYEAINNNPLVYSYKINKTKKHKELDKTIKRLEKDILKEYM